MGRTQKLTADNVDSFLASSPFALVLIDAAWNHHKELAKNFMLIAEGYPGKDFAFAEADGDDFDVVKRFSVSNVPAICYLYGGQPIKTVIGDSQDIKEQVRWFLEDCENGWF